jgi:hypothetical protein
MKQLFFTIFILLVQGTNFCYAQQQPALPDSLQFSLVEISQYRRELTGKDGSRGYVLDANYHKMPAAERQIQRHYYDSAFVASCKQLSEKRALNPSQKDELMWIEKLKKDSVYFLKRNRNMAWFDAHYPPKK